MSHCIGRGNWESPYLDISPHKNLTNRGGCTTRRRFNCQQTAAQHKGAAPRLPRLIRLGGALEQSGGSFEQKKNGFMLNFRKKNEALEKDIEWPNSYFNFLLQFSWQIIPPWSRAQQISRMALESGVSDCKKTLPWNLKDSDRVHSM